MSQAAHAAAIDPADEIRERGYLVVPDFLSADELRALQSDIARLPDRLRSGPLPASVDVQWEKEAARSGELPQPLQLFNVHLLSERLDALMRSAKMRQVAEPFVGAQPAVFHTKYIAKAAHVGSEIPWHQDLSYWLGTVRSPYLVTCLIYLEDATRDNGCLEVVPGSHHRGLLAFQTRSDQAFRLTSKLAPAESSVHAIEAAAGTAVLFGPLMLHRSRANQSPRPRPSISIALTDGTAWNQQMGYLGTPPAVRPEDRPLARLKIPRVHGPGPHHGGWDDFYRRRALRIFAKDFVADPKRTWIEATDLFFEEDSFSWMSSQKFASARLVRFQEYDLVHSNRPDVEVVTGDLVASLAASRPEPAGLVVVDVGTEERLAAVLRAVKPWLASGTILFLDRFFAPLHRVGSRAGILESLARDAKLQLEYLGRADRAVVVRVAGTGAGSVGYADVSWTSRCVGISFGRQSLKELARESFRSSRPVLRFKDAFRPLYWGARDTVRRLRGRG